MSEAGIGALEAIRATYDLASEERPETLRSDMLAPENHQDGLPRQANGRWENRC